MESNLVINRIHPLVAVAAVSVILASFLGIASMTGILPNSHATTVQVTSTAAPAPAPAVASIVKPIQTVVHHHNPAQVPQGSQFSNASAYSQPATGYQNPAPAPHNSPVGIGVGAVVGGLLGNQVGGGNGKTLATIAGAIGGGYLGNEIAKRNP